MSHRVRAPRPPHHSATPPGKMEVSPLEDWATPPLPPSSSSASSASSSSFSPSSSVSEASPFSSSSYFSLLYFSSSWSFHRWMRMMEMMRTRRWTMKKRSFFCASFFVFSRLREKQSGSSKGFFDNNIAVKVFSFNFPTLILV